MPDPTNTLQEKLLGPRADNVAGIAAGTDWEAMSFEDIEWEHFTGPGRWNLNHNDQASASSVWSVANKRTESV